MGQVFVRLARNGNRMKKIALTGNMGSGKSYATRCIKTYGVFVLDMDEVAKQVRSMHEEAIMELLQVQSNEEIATLVFSNSKKKEQLEQYLYPFMLEEMFAFFEEHQNEKICIVEVPLLFEKNWDVYFDEVWCVYSDEATALERLVQYRHIKREEALARLRLQMNAEEKKQRSQIVLYNNKSDCLEEQIKQILHKEGYDAKER